MSTPRYPNGSEIRRSLGRMRVAWSEVESLMKAQIAQALFNKPIEERHTVMIAMHAALGSLTEAVNAYRALLGLDPDAEVPPVIEGTAEVD